MTGIINWCTTDLESIALVSGGDFAAADGYKTILIRTTLEKA